MDFKELVQNPSSVMLGLSIAAAVTVWSARVTPMVTNVTLTVSIVALAVAIFFHPLVQSHPLIVRVLWGTCAGSAAALLAYYTAWVDLSRAVLAPMVMMSNAQQPAGTIIGGVAWDNRFTDLRLVLGNTSKWDYQNLDVTILPDKPIVAAEANSDFATVSLGRIIPPLENTLLGFPDGSMRRVEFFVLASEFGYRIRAELFPAQSYITIRMAIAGMAPFSGIKPASPPKNFGVEDADYVRKETTDAGLSIWRGHPNRPSTVFEPAIPKRIQINGSFGVQGGTKEVALNVPTGVH